MKTIHSLPDEPHFIELIQSVHEGKINQELLLHYLLLPTIEERRSVNRQLAQAFYEIRNYEQAKIHAERAWIFSNFDSEEMSRYIEILEQLNEIDKISFVYKRTGMAEAKRGHYEEAINKFNSSLYAHTVYTKTDTHEYDFDILEKVEYIAEIFELPFQPQPIVFSGSRIKLAYLLYGIVDIGSVIANIAIQFAKLHDKTQFEITFFAPEREEHINSCPHAKTVISKIVHSGCDVKYAPNESDRFERWKKVADQIYEFNPSCIITFAGLAKMEYYFITSILKHIKTIALCFGPPSLYVSPKHDVAIGMAKHLAVEYPHSFEYIPNLGYADLNIQQSDNQMQKPSDLPDQAFILGSMGRASKFQSIEFWNFIEQLLLEFEHVHFMVVGTTEKDISYYQQLSVKAQKKIHFYGWVETPFLFLEWMDIFVNTFPSGGGDTIVQAALRKVPIVSLQNDYLKKFDQKYWIPIDDLLGDEQKQLTSNSIDSLKEYVIKLMQNPSIRIENGNLGYKNIHKKIALLPSRMRTLEKVVLNTVGKAPC